MPKAGDPRTGHTYRTNTAAILANSDICHLCHHPGARTVDHLTTIGEWLRIHGNYQGVNDLTNLAPAHGTAGPHRPPNPCPTCRRLCNQVRGDRSLQPQPRSRNWYSSE